MAAPTPPNRPFELSIGSLLLEGFTHTSRHACETAFAAEFERLVRQRGLPATARAAEWQIPPLSISSNASDSPRRVGRSLAVGLYEALQRAAEMP